VGWGVIDSNTFESWMNLATGTELYFVSAGDFDGDGKADLAVANGGNSTVSIFRNTSSGPGVASYAAKVDFAVGPNARSISVGDMDGDGKADLTVTNYTGNNVSVLRNT